MKKGQENYTLIGPSIPHKLPKRNRVATAIQKFVLNPKSVLKIILKNEKLYKFEKLDN